MLERARTYLTKALGLERITTEETFSLDNYYGDKFLRSITLSSDFINRLREYVEWDDVERIWRKFRVWHEEDEDEENIELTNKNIQQDLRRVLLLRDDELSDIQHISPGELQSFIKNNIPESELIGRVQRVKEYRYGWWEWGTKYRTKITVTGWQKELTQAA